MDGQATTEIITLSESNAGQQPADHPDIPPVHGVDLSRVIQIRGQIAALEEELRVAAGIALPPPEHRVCFCRRCGYQWRAARGGAVPRRCARCGSRAWNDLDPQWGSRELSDPPNPNWRVRKGTLLGRKPKERGPRVDPPGLAPGWRSWSPKPATLAARAGSSVPPDLLVPPSMRERAAEPTPEPPVAAPIWRPVEASPPQPETQMTTAPPPPEPELVPTAWQPSQWSPEETGE